MNHPSMLSYIQSLLNRPYSPSASITGLKRKGTPSTTTTSTSPPHQPNHNVPSDTQTQTQTLSSQEPATASFLGLPDGPLIKRVRRGDDEDASGSGGRSKGRLSVICEGVEEEGQTGRGMGQGLGQSGLTYVGIGGENSANGQREEESHEGEERDGDEDRDVEMEDVDLDGEVDREQGLWTYRGGNSLLR